MKRKNHKQKNILITGGAGFVGSNVLEYLFRKYPKYNFSVIDLLTYAGDIGNIPVDILKSHRFNFVYGDIRNQRLVDFLVGNSDIVLHFAAETHVARSLHDNFKFFETDVLGTQVLANAVLQYKNKIERFIHISTSEVYGTADASKINEKHGLTPRSPYAAAKVGADRLVHSYFLSYGIPVIIVRPFNIYGPRQHLEKLIPRIITHCIRGERPTIHGDGSAKRDFTYVLDIADAIDKVLHVPLKKVLGEVINIGSGKAYSVNEIVNFILGEFRLPKSTIRYIGDRPGQVYFHRADNQKAKKLLGWEPHTLMNDGLRKTVDWFKNNYPWWKNKVWLRHVPVITSEGKIEYQ